MLEDPDIIVPLAKWAFMGALWAIGSVVVFLVVLAALFFAVKWILGIFSLGRIGLMLGSMAINLSLPRKSGRKDDD